MAASQAAQRQQALLAAIFALLGGDAELRVVGYLPARARDLGLLTPSRAL
jgi:hypothetical protein